jgi:cation diffusion facilitator family transporter
MGGHHHHASVTDGNLARAGETKRITLIGAVVNLLLSVIKVALGIVSQSHSLVADGVHSLSDLISDGVIYAAAHHAHHGPDEKHPYGHGRFETAATLALGVLLVLVATGIVWDAADRLFHPERLLEPTALALLVAAVSILAKELLYHYTVRVARRIRSEMLKANAWHHRSDAVSSVAVLVGVGGTMAGLPYLDTIAAVVVGLMIARIGWELGKSAFQELVDSSLDEEQVKKINEAIFSIGGVKDLHMLRTRSSGGRASVDVHVMVDPWLSVSEGHQISQAVIDRLVKEFDEISDVTVHIDAEDDEKAAPCQGLPLRKEAEEMLEARWGEIPGWERRERVLFHYLDGRIDVDVHLPMDLYRDEEQRRALLESMSKGVADVAEFGEVRLYFC